MKSIKEKSEEHAPYTREDSWNKAQRCIIAQTSFEAGANYVLEQIEQALTPQKCLTDIGIDVSPEALIKTALQTIEQLKR